MTTKLATLYADLDALGQHRIDVEVSCNSSSRSYIYFFVAVTLVKNRKEFSAKYKGSDLNRLKIAGTKWADFYLPRLEDDLVEAVKCRDYRANSNLFRALRQVVGDAMATV